MSKASVICYGEFDWPDNNAKQSYIRNAFLHAVETHAPDFWKDLYDRAFPIYKDLKSECPHLAYRDFYYYVTSPLSHDLTRPFYVQYGKLALLIRFLSAWSHKWNLVESDDAAPRWVLDIALANLEMWSLRSVPLAAGEEPEFFSAGAGYGGAIPNVPKPPEGFPEYDALNIRQKSYLEWVHTKALDAIKEHPLLKHGTKPKQRMLADSVQAVAKSYCRKVDAVFERCRFKRSSKDQKRKLAQHLEWTVRVQVRGETESKVAASAEVSLSSVSRAVDETLDLVGLKKRSDLKRGRLAGSKNQRSVESDTLRRLGR